MSRKWRVASPTTAGFDQWHTTEAEASSSMSNCGTHHFQHLILKFPLVFWSFLGGLSVFHVKMGQIDRVFPRQPYRGRPASTRGAAGAELLP